MKMNIEFKGFTEIEESLRGKAKMDDVKKIVKYDGAQLQQKMQQNAVFTKGYSHGDTQGSIGLQITDQGLTARVGPTTEYSPYLEYGTRFMEAQPFIRPSLKLISAQFIAHLKKLLN